MRRQATPAWCARDRWERPIWFYEEVDQRRVEKKTYHMFLHDYERDAIDAFLNRHERVLGVDAVRVEHVRVAAHRREEHVLQYGRRQ